MKFCNNMEEIIEKAVSELRLDKSQWSLTKFGDVAIQQNKSVDRDNTDLTRYVKGEHMGSEDLHLREWGVLTDEYLGPAFIRKFEEGDILYGSRRTYLRKVVIAPFEGITSNTTFVIKANEKRIDKGLLPFIMMSEGFTQNSIRNSKGSVNPYINWKDIAKYEFLLPPKDQQAQLAELLWAMDEVIERERILLSTINILKETLRKKYFSLNFSAKTVKLGELARITAGGTPSTEKDEYWNNGTIPWLSSGEVHKKVVYETEKLISDIGLKNSSAKIMPKQTCLIALAGQGKTKGTVAISEIELCTNQSVASIIANPDKVEPYYLFYNLDSRYMDFRHLTGKENSRTGLNLKILNEFRIKFHEKKERSKILAEFKCLEFNLGLVESKISSSKSLQKSLINQIF